jgi:cysteine synthase
VCGQMRHPFVAVMSRGNSVERAKMMKAFGAEVVLVDQAPGSQPGQVSGADLALVEQATQQIVVQRQAFRADQFLLPSCVTAHARTTGPELWRQSGESLTAFCDFVGTGSTYAGTMQALRQFSHNTVKGYIVEPDTNPSHQNEHQHQHPIQGGGYMMKDLHFLKNDVAHVDGYVAVTGDEARSTARLLAKHEGIFAGFSAGANVAAALQLLEGPEAGGTISVIICDSGLKYLSTALWED